ncbi:MAG: 5-oxoprolinase subunit PxpB [Crocinitomicaceae bacterium]
MDKPTIRKYGPRGILMEWEPSISPEVNDQVIRTAQLIKQKYDQIILEVVPSYHSLLVFLKKEVDHQSYIAISTYIDIEIYRNSKSEEKPTWHVPTCYDPSFGYDLASISETSQLPIASIIRLHSEVKYRIYGMGFLPGFLYLGGLDKRLHLPRKSQIKQFVPKGSVAIGGQQTGIYPQTSPGGWNVIGKTPIELFNPQLDNPTPFSIGDSIQFVPVDLDAFNDIQARVKEGNYQLKSVFDD